MIAAKLVDQVLPRQFEAAERGVGVERSARLLHDLLDLSRGLLENSVALRHHDATIRYRDLQSTTLRVAGGFCSLGVRRGDRVVILLQNRPEVVEAALACSRLGAVFVPVNPSLRARQLLHILRDSGATAIIGAGSALSAITAACIQDGVHVRNIVFADKPEIKGPVHEGLCLASMDDIRNSTPLAGRPCVIDRDLAAIMYTSGSTGPAKGVMASHRNLVAGASIVSEYLANEPTDRILAALPLSFDYGFSQVSTALTVGAAVVLTNFSMPAALLQEAAAEAVTGLAGVPTMWAHLAASEWPASLQESLRYITNSGGALHPTLISLLRSRLPRTQVFCMYGLTEAFRSTYLPPSALDERMGSIGKAIPDQEILVLRPDGSECERGETGELVHRGSLVTLGYWRDPEKTALRFRPLPPQLARGGAQEVAVWSGDQVRSDPDGFLYFVGRTDQMIKTSGYRVSPTEVEEVVAEVEGVVDVVAVGAPDAIDGQRIVVIAVVSNRPGGEALEAMRRHCRMHLPPYMTPAEFHLVETISRNANGKPDRAELMQWAASPSRFEGGSKGFLLSGESGVGSGRGASDAVARRRGDA